MRPWPTGSVTLSRDPSGCHNGAMPLTRHVASLGLILLMSATPGFAQTAAPAAGPDAALLAQSEQLQKDGRLDEALDVARHAMTVAPDSSAAHLQVGVLLDLAGKYAEARTHITTAIAKATTPDDSKTARCSMAVSYAFERNCKSAVPFESAVFDQDVAAKDFEGAAGVANELARICLESGDIDTSAIWYRTGYDTALKQAGLTEQRRDLWNFRWEHAQARIAARRGDAAAAESHAATATALAEKGSIPEQRPFVPYLAGYVAYYGGHYIQAVSDLGRANQNDPFILALTAMALEKSGDTARAKPYYERILALTTHNPVNAFARPLAREKLAR